MASVSGHRSDVNPLRLLIVDRYLLRQFLKSYLIFFCSLTGLYSVIDGFGNLEEFITYSQKHGSLLAVMGEYYGYRALTFFDSISPVLTLVAAMFTVTWIQRHNELTALLAAGIPKARTIRSIIVATVALIGLRVANREFVIPRVRSHLTYNAQNLGGSSGQTMKSQYDNETLVLLGGSRSKVFGDQRRISKPDFYLPPGLDRHGSRLAAEDAFYRPPQEGRPGGYLFEQVEEPQGLANLPSLSLAGREILLTPHDHAWLKADQCFVASNVVFEQIAGGNTWRQLSSTAELRQGLHNRSLDFGADERLAIHARIVQPVLDMTLLFLGLPLVLSRSNRNVFVAIGMCLALVVGFMLVVFTCQFLGGSRSYLIEPALAAWVPVMIFVPFAVALSQPFHE